MSYAPELFSPWALRRRDVHGHWKRKQGEGPTVGMLAQMYTSSLVYLLDPEVDCLYFVGNDLAYVQEINPNTEEALIHCPLLHNAPWCKDRWALIDLWELHPVTIYGFNEAQFREKNLEKASPFPTEWGKLEEHYNRRVNQRSGKGGTP